MTAPTAPSRKNGSVSFNLDLLANEEHIHCACLQNQSYGPYHDHDQDTKWVGISSLKSVKSYGATICSMM